MNLKNLLNLETLCIYKKDVLVGHLHRGKNSCTFKYTEDYFNSTKLGLSFLINKENKEFKIRGENLHPFFAGLLPEGLRLNSLIKTTKTSSSDLFTLLAAAGSDLIGDIYALPENHLIEEDYIHTTNSDFSSLDFWEVFNKSISSNELSAKKKDSAIPGVQAKVSAAIISFPLRIANKKKSYILKLTGKDFPAIAENEHFFMQLAKKCKIDTAETKLVIDAKNNTALLVERFDRFYSKNKEIEKLHQEDACQFLNRYPQDKYRLNFREIASGVKNYATASNIEILRLVDLLMFSYLIGNGDLHAKNISLIINEENKILLTKGYDLLSTLPYGDQSMALNFEGRKDNFKRKDFLAFGKAFNIPEKIIIKSIERISAGVFDNKKSLSEIPLIAKKITFLSKTIDKRLIDLN